MRVVIAGAGDVGLNLAKNLARKENNELILIDFDEERCDELASEMNAMVIHGDASDPEILKKAQIEEADALVATTGSDPINTVIAMLGSRMGMEKIIVTLKGYGLRSACQEIGVSRIVAPKISASAEIVSTLYNLDRVNFSVLSSGGLQLVEVQVNEDIRKQFEEVEIPDGAHVVAILRGEQMILPRKNLKLKGGDELLLLVEDESIRDSIRDQFENRNE